MLVFGHLFMLTGDTKIELVALEFLHLEDLSTDQLTQLTTLTSAHGGDGAEPRPRKKDPYTL